MTTRVEVPDALRLRHRQTAEGRHWLGEVPGYVDQALAQWGLCLDLPPGGRPWHGHSGIVVPVLTADGGRAALKVAFPHDEALLEPLALALWGGSGAVRMLAHDASIGAMLLERLDERRSLLELPMEEAVPAWGAVMAQLQVRPDARPEWRELPHIAAAAERYSDELPQTWMELGEPFPRWLLEAALEVCQTLGAVGRRSSNDVLVHTDLHYQNVLARPGGATGYLAIDPQVQVGDAEFAVAPCLWNRIQDLPALDTEAALRRRASGLSRAAGLNEDLAGAWAVLREVENALTYLSDSLVHDAQRSLWVASTMAGRTLPGLPAAHELHRLY